MWALVCQIESCLIPTLMQSTCIKQLRRLQIRYRRTPLQIPRHLTHPNTAKILRINNVGDLNKVAFTNTSNHLGNTPWWELNSLLPAPLIWRKWPAAKVITGIVCWKVIQDSTHRTVEGKRWVLTISLFRLLLKYTQVGMSQTSEAPELPSTSFHTW